MKEGFVLRQAGIVDVDEIFDIISFNANKEVMLPKTKKQIIETLFNFLVVVVGDEVIGTCAVKFWADQSVEIVSLATLEGYKGQGIATRLIQANIEKCRQLGFKRFFAMTVAPEVFTKSGFKVVNYERFWFKVWVDCSCCPRNAGTPGSKKCNEEAVELLLD